MSPSLFFRSLLCLAAPALLISGCTTNDADQNGGLSQTSMSAIAGADDGIPPTYTIFRAVGDEPGWIVTIDDSLEIHWDYDEYRVTVAVPEAETEDGVVRYSFTHEGTPFVITVREGDCTDTMAGREYPAVVEVMIGDRKLTGCGGKSSPLIDGGEWSITSMQGASLIPDSRITMQFADESRIVGNASCNRYALPYRASGSVIHVEDGLLTRMFCGGGLDDQEARFIALLNGELTVRIDDAGNLHVERDGKEVLTASPRLY